MPPQNRVHDRLPVPYGLAARRVAAPKCIFGNFARQILEENSERILMRNLVRFTWLAALAGLFLMAATPRQLLAQGETNPTGVSGIFNGNTATADSVSTYDCWTGNFMRGPIDDVVVPGTVGAYPLKFSRTYNSQGLAGWAQDTLVSGALGNSMGQYWRHSYSLTVGDWGGGPPTDWHEGEGFVFPDGRVISADPTSNFPPIEERFDDATHNWVMADGGKVHLGYSWGFAGASGISADSIIDPYGQVTTIEHDPPCQNCSARNRIKKVTDVGSGKYLEFTYYDLPGEPDSLGLIQKVEAHDSNGDSMGISAEVQLCKAR